MTPSKISNFPARAKAAVCVLAVATATGISFHAAAVTSDLLTLPSDAIPALLRFSQKVSTQTNGILRSSRAVFTVASTVVDYKYSLRGLQKDSAEYLQKLSEVHLRSAKRIMKLCEANKGYYVKAGQYVATLPLVPKEYTTTLSSLQDQVAPYNFKAITEVLIDNLGPDFSELFLSIDEEPVASASIAQVHHAVLKDGHEVAIKVQYPGIEQQMNFDAKTLSLLSKIIAQLFPEYRFEWLASSVAETMPSELDFVQEARNSERIAKNFRNKKMIRVPHVFWELTTRKVLTMQFCKGYKIVDLDCLNQIGVGPEKAVKTLLELYAEMIFVHGYIHSDPHPGNILVSPEGHNGFSLVLLDHGVCRELDEEFRKNFCQLWEALVLQDSEKIVCLGEQFGVQKYSRYLPIIFTGRTIESKDALGVAMSIKEKENMKKELKTLLREDLSSFMESLPPDFVTILRVDGLLRSIIRTLGVSRMTRWLAYSKYSVYGLSSRVDVESDFGNAVTASIASQLRFFRIVTRLVIGEIAAKPWVRMKNMLLLLYGKINSDFGGLLIHAIFLLCFWICPNS